MIKKCVQCKAEFYAPPSSKKITCSKECSSAHRKEMLTGVKRSEEVKENMSKSAKERQSFQNLSKGTPSAKVSAKGGRFETNSNAKGWVLLSPDKKVYKCVNLQEFIRKNIELFECELTDENVSRISHGFYRAKKNIKENSNTITYKDWTILSWRDENNYNMEKQHRKAQKD